MILSDTTPRVNKSSFCRIGASLKVILELNLSRCAAAAGQRRYLARGAFCQFAQGKGKFKVVGLIFKEKNYGIALKVNSGYRDKINIALLQLMEEGVYQRLCDKWFGS